VRDRILDFSEARTGAYWFAPCLEELAAVGFGDSDPTPE
jgi:hypothetical protein